MAPPVRPEPRIRVGPGSGTRSPLGSLILLESLYSTGWFDELLEELGPEAGELLAAIGRDASDHAEELRRVLDLWGRAGGEEGARRFRDRLGVEMVALVRDQRRRAAALLEEASERAPTAEIERRLRQLAREARAHADRLGEHR